MNLPDEKKTLQSHWFRKMPLLVLLLMIILVIAVAMAVSRKGERLAAERSTASDQEETGTNVVVLVLTPSQISDRINLPGIISPWVRLTVSAEVAGKVDARLAEEGHHLTKGTPLYRLDERDYRTSYHAARAAFETARASHSRLRELHDEQLTSRSILDTAVAELERTRSAMETARLQLDRCLIEAGMDGILNRMLVEPGQFVAVGDPVAEILQLNPVKVTVGIPESDIHAVREVDTFSVRMDALGGRIFSGTRHRFSRSAEGMARLYDLEIRIENPDDVILPDMFARVDIVKQSRPMALTLPIYAVISSGGTHSVFVESRGRAEKRDVTLGMQEGWQVEILSGLTAGERVVVVGQRDISHGQALRIIKEIHDTGEL
ncbi:efflux RND transporter periplasmic adaptor subunit [Desulfobotulus sp. H1]|uniref:Efflux RND transporter periplasmic adaptor subunit n=1 Tax=Desulfobotulus pelophilus TaxID=2823377 RepID=A0ABT3NA59_9BACT|nr:efflux RND transporter periplasmic adaptor subunit [Desulfobotulus pelophilus]MCW7754320.1 efflux RND transporter periplasmic adaptor subunit [Desulfobotulus pelophilus]